MYTYYVSLDDDGYASSTPATEATDGLTAIVLYTSTDKEQFLRHYTKYRHDENGNWISPDNLPSLQVSSLLRSIQDQGQIIADQKGTITDLQTDLATAQTDATKAKADAKTANDALTAANTTIKSLQQMAGQLTAQSVAYQSTITQLQQLVGQMTAQIVQLQSTQTTTATKEA